MFWSFCLYIFESMMLISQGFKFQQAPIGMTRICLQHALVGRPTPLWDGLSPGVVAKRPAAALQLCQRPTQQCRRSVRSLTAKLRGGGGSSRGIHAAPATRFFSTNAIDIAKNGATPHGHTRLITFLTDVEGDKAYLDRYVRNSKVLRWVPFDEHSHDDTLPFPYDHCLDFASAHGVLVYGGDVWDQGGHDLYVIRQLLQLRRRHPDRVYFIMGNRDVNKLRMRDELGPANGSGASCPDLRGVYWLRHSGRHGDPEIGPVTRDPVERLRWMLQHTMGSPQAFAFRQQELQQLGAMTDAIPDIDVVHSYRASSRREMVEYLRHAHLALRLGEVLFVHGALPITEQLQQQNPNPNVVWDDLGWAMPWLRPEDMVHNNVTCIDDWLHALNSFAHACIKDFCNEKQSTRNTIWSEKGGYHNADAPLYGRLVQYGMGWLADKSRNPTVVYASWSNNGMPRRFFDEHSWFMRATSSFLERSGISLICSGHQPQGDMPNAIRVPVFDRTAWICSCDTSYSGDTHWHAPSSDDVEHRSNDGRQGGEQSGRGPVAVGEMLIEQCTTSGKILDAYMHGTLSDGTVYRTISLDFDATSKSHSDDLVAGTLTPERYTPPTNMECAGQQPPGPWWTRAAFTDGTYLIVCGQGFDVWNRIVKP